MFWENLIELCNKHNTTPTAVVNHLGLAKGNVTSWKSGKTPHATTLKKLSDYFAVDTSYFSVEHSIPKGTNESAPISVSSTKNEKPSDNGELPEKNVVTIIGRDGRYIQKKLTDEQIQALETIINQMPDAPDEI